VQFNGSASTTAQPPIVSYSWDFGDGTALAGGATVTHTYSTPGPYHPVLTITDNAGLTGQAGIDITVTAPAPPPPAPVNPTAVISSSNAVGNAPLTVQFDGSASTSAQPPIVSYSWDFGDGAIAGGATVAHSYTIPGTYSAVLTITDNAGLTSQAKTPVMIGAAPLPEVIPPISSFIATPSSGTSPLKVAFNASGSSAPAGSISEYRWDFGDGTSAIGITPKHTFVAKANYLVTLKVTDNLGGTATSSETVSVLKLVKKEPTDKEDNVITPILYLLLLK
jgi:PKD repeat protein